jgi:CRP-like cAMP-binding protein
VTGQSSTADLLRDLPLFSQVGPEQITTLAARTRTRRLPRGETLFHQGDPAVGCFVVVEGVVKLAVLAADGGEKVVEVIHAGESFGEAVMLLGQPYPVTATALEAARLITVPLAAVEQLLDSDPMFARRMLAGMALRLHARVRDVESYALRSSRERVISYLVACAEGVDTQPPGVPALPGVPTLPGGEGVPEGEHREHGHHQQLVVVLPTSKQVIASRLSLTPETFSRTLRELSDRGLLTVKGRQITVPDLDALAQSGRSSHPSGEIPRR